MLSSQDGLGTHAPLIEALAVRRNIEDCLDAARQVQLERGSIEDELRIELTVVPRLTARLDPSSSEFLPCFHALFQVGRPEST